jgi:hypothetical protein
MKEMERSILATSLIIAAAACSASDPRLPPPATDPRATGPVNTGDTAGPSAGETTAGAAGPGAGAGAGSGSVGAGAAYGGSDAARLAIRLVDAPSDQVTSIFVTLAKVDALLPSGWTTIVEKEQGIDLLTLQNGQFLALGLAALRRDPSALRPVGGSVWHQARGWLRRSRVRGRPGHDGLRRQALASGHLVGQERRSMEHASRHPVEVGGHAWRVLRRRRGPRR